MNPLSNTHELIDLSRQVGEMLNSYQMMLTTAESCTGGWVAQTITALPDSSNWFERGFITYSNAAKQEMLKVREATLLKTGAVSKETAIEMARGALTQSLAQVSIAITGIAGPTGSSEQKPIGTVWIAWAAKGSQCVAELFQFSGNREAIRYQAVAAALKGLLSLLTYSNTSLGANISPPVITLDGPSGVGKGTLSRLIAKKLGWHYLDSGASFRVLAHAALQKNVGLNDESALEMLANNLDFRFTDDKDSPEIKVLLDDKNVDAEIRSEDCGTTASKIATLQGVRHALLKRQRAFRKWPGLVTDGRDMGTVIFPDATLKFFLHASPAERARRRVKQLKNKGMHAKLAPILRDLKERDKRDQERGVAPLMPAQDALIIDTTELSIEASLAEIMRQIVALF